MNKMFNGINQNFQISSCFINEEKENLNYECKNNADSKNILPFGEEISIINLDNKLRDDFTYNAYANNNRYLISLVDNFICIKYQLHNYDELC